MRKTSKCAALSALAMALLLTGCAALSSGRTNQAQRAQSVFGPELKDLELIFPPEKQARYSLADGSEVYEAHGWVTNVGNVEREVPTLLVNCFDRQDAMVCSQEAQASKVRLAPGERATFDQTVSALPERAQYVLIGWKPADVK